MIPVTGDGLSTGITQRTANTAQRYLFVSLLIRTLMKCAGGIGRKQLGLKPWAVSPKQAVIGLQSVTFSIT